MPPMYAASRALPAGTTNLEYPRALAEMRMGKMPAKGRSLPSSASSPKNTVPAHSPASCPVAFKMPTAMARSKYEPSFFRSAGARLTVIFWVGNRRPLFLRAERTRSRLSLTAVSGKPTSS